MTRIDTCPFCNEPPETYFEFFASTNEFPVFSANIACKKCGIVLSQVVTAARAAKPTFDDVETIVNQLIQKWNRRA